MHGECFFGETLSLTVSVHMSKFLENRQGRNSLLKGPQNSHVIELEEVCSFERSDNAHGVELESLVKVGSSANSDRHNGPKTLRF
jgi:hypothetical protein